MKVKIITIVMQRAHILFKKLCKLISLKNLIINLKALWKVCMKAGWILAKKEF